MIRHPWHRDDHEPQSLVDANRIAADIWAQDAPLHQEAESNAGLRLVLGIAPPPEPIELPERPSEMTDEEDHLHHELKTAFWALWRQDVRTWDQWDALPETELWPRGTHLRGIGNKRARLIAAWRTWMLSGHP